MKSILTLILIMACNLLVAEPLEAVLILGTNLDQSKQYSHLAELERISSFFSTKNVIVHKFYAGDAKWEEVIKVSPRCSFFIYFGHGGMKNFLNMNGFVDSNTIVRDLKLKSNAIVLLGHCCFSAGSSSSDDSQIDLSTSKNRVMSRSSVFFKTGASVYYSNNFVEGILIFLINLYQGESIEGYHRNFINGGLFRSPEISMREEISEDYKEDKHLFLYSDRFKGEKYRTYDLCIIGDLEFNINCLK